MNDSDRNIMLSMAHEPCTAHCDECGACITDDSGYVIIGIDTICADCADEYTP